ncbi:MAG: glucosidase, partial [Myxococcales bacterium]|nr:glucosidase [Myxococcales bacterium]
MDGANAEIRRLRDDADREAYWRRWGPYVADRQWGTVREDYSADGDAWRHFPFEHAHLRTYRWGEDALFGICDRQGRLHLGLGLWNGRDPLLKERLFGLAGPEGNHGEDSKELYFHLDAVPSHAWLEALYKYPQAAFPYDRLREVNARLPRTEPEYELLDTGVFDEDRYFDVRYQLAKATDDDLCVRVRVTNRGPEDAVCHVLLQLWWRNTWSWGRTGEGYWARPSLDRTGHDGIRADGMGLAPHLFWADACEGERPELLFTENETARRALYGVDDPLPWVKDAFHRRVVHGERGACNPEGTGTKAAAWWSPTVRAGATVEVRVRLHAEGRRVEEPFGPAFDAIFERRRAEADAWHAHLSPAGATPEERQVQRQAAAGLIWTRQFYTFVVKDWLEGDAPAQPPPPAGRDAVRNAAWAGHLYNRDIISMPDKWEYPWYAAWDLAFHMVPFARIDPAFAKDQLELFVREWYLHPNGQIPAYEWNFSDVNPPVHAWAAWRVYKLSAPKGQRDRRFLAHIFQKLLLNFT